MKTKKYIVEFSGSWVVEATSADSAHKIAMSYFNVKRIPHDAKIKITNSKAKAE